MRIAGSAFYKNLSRNRTRYIAHYINRFIPSNSNILDFGCGNAFVAETLLELQPSVRITGIDVIRDPNITEERLANKHFNFVQYSANALPFAENAFDLVIASSSMHHTDNPEFYLAEFCRILKPKGLIVLVEEMYSNWLDFVWISWQDYALNKLKKGVPVPLNFRSRKHYLQEFHKLGLTILSESHIRPNFPYQHHYVFCLQTTTKP